MRGVRMLNQALKSVLCLAYVVCAAYLAAQSTAQRELATEDARHLARAALPSSVKRLPGLTLLSGPKRERPQRCVVFDVLWANPDAGSVHVGYWAVDMRTGEVWAPVLCERINTKALRSLQRAFRKRLSLNDAEWQAA